MDEKTVMVAPEEERTQMAGTVECPVCHESSVPTAAWCAECGFRLGSEHGEVEEAPASWALMRDGERFPLHEGENVVGRLNADVFLSDSSVSRRHAVVTVSPSGVTVRDENSSNGTRVGGTRIPAATETPLRPGETVQFGGVEMAVEAPEGVELPEVAEIPEMPAEAVEAAPDEAPEPRPAQAILTNGVDTWPLHAGPNSVGRRGDNDVVLSDPAVSGRHAIVTIRDGEATLADVGSTNGTFLGGQRVVPGAESVLEPGVEIRFGRVALNYEAVPEGAAIDAPEEAAMVDASVETPWEPAPASGVPASPPASALRDTASGAEQAPAPDDAVWADAGEDSNTGA